MFINDVITRGGSGYPPKIMRSFMDSPLSSIVSNKIILVIICFTLCIHIWPLIKVLRSKSFETSGFSPCPHHFFWKFQSLCQNQSLPCFQTRYGLLFSPGKPLFLTFDVEKNEKRLLLFYFPLGKIAIACNGNIS